MFNKLSIKLAVIFLILSIIPMIFVSYLAFVNQRQTIEQNMINHLTATTILKKAEFQLWIEDKTHVLTALANDPGVYENAAVLLADELDTTEREERIIDIRLNHFESSIEIEGNWIELFLLQASDGMIFLSSNLEREGMFQESQPFFIEGQSGVYIQNVYYSMILEEPALTIGTPVKDGEGNVVAVLAGRVDLAEIADIMSKGRGESESEETYLINKFKFWITASRFDLGNAQRKAIHTEGVEACLAQNDGSGLYDDYRGVPIIGVYHWIQERDLCILTEVDQAEAFAPIVLLRSEMLETSIVVALFVIVLALFFARSITEPVLQIVTGTEEIGRGNLDYKIEIKNRDEIGQLADAFNAMTARRKQAREDLRNVHDRLQLSIERMPVAYILWDSAGEITEWNPAAESIFGYTKEEAVGKTLLHLVVPEDVQPLVAETLQSLLAGVESSYSEPGNNIRKDGTIISCRWFNTPIEFSHGETVAVLSMAIDVTEQVRVEEAIKESEVLYRDLVETSQDLIWKLDSKGKFVYLNEAWETTLGYEVDEMLGSPISDFKPEEVIERDIEVFRDIISGGQVKGHETAYLSKSGEMVHLVFNAMPWYDPDGNIIGTQGTAHDFTERKHAEDELVKSAQELETQNAALERFTYTVSHDLKSPLLTIQGFLGHLADDVTSGDADLIDEDIQQITSATEKMERLLDDLLDLSRLGRVAKPFKKIDLNELLDELIELLKGQIEARKVEIKVQPGLPQVNGDRDRLLEVFQNLIENAVKYMGEQPNPLIQIGVNTIMIPPIFYVSDNGIGINPRYGEKVFGLFEKLDPESEGTGIGLALVKRIIDLHNGRIWVDSKGLGHGSSFKFTLP